VQVKVRWLLLSTFIALLAGIGLGAGLVVRCVVRPLRDSAAADARRADAESTARRALEFALADTARRLDATRDQVARAETTGRELAGKLERSRWEAALLSRAIADLGAALERSITSATELTDGLDGDLLLAERIASGLQQVVDVYNRVRRFDAGSGP